MASRFEQRFRVDIRASLRCSSGVLVEWISFVNGVLSGMFGGNVVYSNIKLPEALPKPVPGGNLKGWREVLHSKTTQILFD